MDLGGRHPELEYYPCRYGGSRLTFRGPPASMDGPYTVVIGGSEVYGRFVEDPFCDQLAERTGRQVLNLGIVNGGLDAYVRDPAIMVVIGGAESVIVQAMGAANLSNRFYAVHPRRNDRYIRHSPLMREAFPGIDFTDFTFTTHMLATLMSRAPQRFEQLRRELRQAWVGRMRLLLGRIPGQKTLLWLENARGSILGPDPLFVDAEMLQALEGHIDKVVHCDVTEDQTTKAMAGMTYGPAEADAARLMLTPAAHVRVAEGLARVVRRRDGLAA